MVNIPHAKRCLFFFPPQARHAKVSNSIMQYLIESAPEVFEVPLSFKDAYRELMATGAGAVFPERPDAVQKFSASKFQVCLPRLDVV